MSDYNNSQRTGYKITFKSGLQFAIGLIYLGIAGYMIVKQQFGAVALGKGVSYGLGTLLIIYGLFRMWRAIQEMKITADD